MIQLDQLSKRYGALQALDGVSLNVPAGCLYGLLGPNGAGKTTCLRILCTLLAPDAGSVQIAGIDALADPRAAREQLGYVAQEVAIDKILSGRELLQLQSSLYHLDSATSRRRIDELTELLGMGEWLDRRCGTYSGGMRRRLDLASGLLHSPAVLVLDEPTVGLDIESRAALWQVLQQLRNDGTTVLLSNTVVPLSRSCCNTCHSAARLSISSPTVGSSSTSTAGLCSSPLAKSRRRRMPPE